MSRVFLDVGAHTGQTVDVVLDPIFAFDRVVCFEPARASQTVLARIADPRVRVEPFGLWNTTCEREIFEPGRKGASIFADKNRIDARVREVCRLVRAADWFREHLTTEDAVFLKLNCEGCECDIVEDLLDSGEFRKVASALIFLDVEKIPSQAHRAEELRQRLRQEGHVRHHFAGEFPAGSHRRRIHAWLTSSGATVSSPGVRVRQWRYDVRRGLIGATNGALNAGALRLLRKVVPVSLYAQMQSAWRRAQGRRAGSG